MKFFTILLFTFLALSCDRTREINVQEERTAKIQQEMHETEVEELRKELRSDTRIKLKRDGKGNYSWEITGRNVQEVIKINETLRKKLIE